MARTVILGAGVAGHTAALHLRRMVGKEHDVVVVAPNSKWNWIPSNIWVGVGQMTVKQVTFPLAPIYQRKGVEFHQALAIELHGEGSTELPRPHVTVRYTDPAREGEVANLEYDYLINATGPKLNFGATPGLGPDGNTWSVCTAGHAVETAKAFDDVVARLKGGEHQTLLIGMGHGTCTCQGAAFEYTFNVEHELVKEGVRDKAEVIYITNETQLGDFGMDGMNFGHKGDVIPSQMFTESLFQERGVKAIMSAHVERVEPGVAHYEQVDGTKGEQPFDFAMLLPPFRGVDLTAFDAAGTDVTDEVFAPSGFMKVDADYTPEAVRGVEGQRLAEDLPVGEVRQRVGRRHRVRAPAPDVPPADEPQRHGDRPGTAAHGDAVRRHRPGRGADHRRSASSTVRRARCTRRRWPTWVPPASRRPARAGARAPPPP